MPRLSRPVLVRRLSEQLPQLPVIFMGSYSEEDDLNISTSDWHAVVLQTYFTPKMLESEIRRVPEQASDS